MKCKGLAVVVMVLGSLVGITSQAVAQAARSASYRVIDLGATVASPFSQATYVSRNGLISGFATQQDGTQHAILWVLGHPLDISSPGLGGPNSGAFGVNQLGQVDGIAESSETDPNGENFCGYFTAFKCIPFRWSLGRMQPLPLLGGNNGTVSIINNRGEIAGAAETSTRDVDCPNAVAVNGTGPQVLDYAPVIWGESRKIRRLSLLPNDTVGMAMWINDKGQAVGFTGTCDSAVPPPFAAGAHAIMWDSDGTAHDLGNLGGTFNPAGLGVGNVAFAINNRGQVTGASALPGSETIHAFFWTKQTAMRDLGTLPGDNNSAGLGMNDLGDVVGASVDGNPITGNPKAVLWRNGTITDLNSLVPADTALYLLTAFDINNDGEIVGFGFDTNTSELHAFVAKPMRAGDTSTNAGERQHITLSDRARHTLNGLLQGRQF